MTKNRKNRSKYRNMHKFCIFCGQERPKGDSTLFGCLYCIMSNQKSQHYGQKTNHQNRYLRTHCGLVRPRSSVWPEFVYGDEGSIHDRKLCTTWGHDHDHHDQNYGDVSRRKGEVIWRKWSLTRVLSRCGGY